MSKLFKYDVVTLIELVESRSCLWDKTADCFKDKIEKQKVWKEVCAFLEDDFLQLDKKQQHKIGELISGKWQNVRDSFVKSLKKKSGQATSKKYIYHDSLQFMMKIIQKDDTESSIQDSQQLRDTEDEEEMGKEEEIEMDARDGTSAKSNKACNLRKKARMQENIDREILKSLNSSRTSPDEDEAFFISITPSVRRMSEEDKLDFRMSVLQLIKDIKSRDKNRPVSVPIFSPGSSSSTSRTSTPFSHYPTSFTDSTHYSQQTQLFQCDQPQFPCNSQSTDSSNMTSAGPSTSFMQDH